MAQAQALVNTEAFVFSGSEILALGKREYHLAPSGARMRGGGHNHGQIKTVMLSYTHGNYGLIGFGPGFHSGL